MPNIITSLLKIILYTIIPNNFKKKIYKMRFLGSINSIIGKKSFMRLENINVKEN